VLGVVSFRWQRGHWTEADMRRDVAAGIAILLEAGGLVTTANPPYPNEDTAPIEEVRLGSRLYLAIRPAGASATETGRQSQERTVREVWKRVRNLEYNRPGA
jgi:myo-inositol-1(or 4)-monophosphatase